MERNFLKVWEVQIDEGIKRIELEILYIFWFVCLIFVSAILKGIIDECFVL